jgi:hypothetical protein
MQNGRLDADGVLNADFLAQFAANAIFRFHKVADAEETLCMFARRRVFQLKTLPRTNMDAEVASGAKFLVNDRNRSIFGAFNEFTDIAVLVTNGFYWTNHPACAAVDTYIRVNHMKHFSVAGDCINGTVGQARHTTNTLFCYVIGHIERRSFILNLHTFSLLDEKI